MQRGLKSKLCLCVGLSIQWRHQQVVDGDDGLEDVGGRMTRVLLASTGECIGTAARFQQDGVTVSRPHVFVDGGNFLDATGWGEKVGFVASSPHDDIMFLQDEAQLNNSWLMVRLSVLRNTICEQIHIVAF